MFCCISNSIVSSRFDLLKSLWSFCFVWSVVVGLLFFIEAAVCCFYVARLRFLLKGYDSARMLGLAFGRPIGVLFSRFFFLCALSGADDIFLFINTWKNIHATEPDWTILEQLTHTLSRGGKAMVRPLSLRV